MLLNANSRRDASGGIVGVSSVSVRTSPDRIAQEQEYVPLIDTANAPIFGIDADGLVNVWNKKAEQITGFNTEEVMGHNLVEEFITPRLPQVGQEVLDQALLGEQASNFEFPLITKTKTRVEVLLNATSRRVCWQHCRRGRHRSGYHRAHRAGAGACRWRRSFRRSSLVPILASTMRGS